MRWRGQGWGLLLGAAVLAAGSAHAGDRQPLETLLRSTHVHGIAVDRADASRLLIATHHGLLRGYADGTGERISQRQDDFMGFTPHPTDKMRLFASGHPALGGNLGFIESVDGGRTWRQVSPGAGGPVDFHQMDVSKADPAVVYGVFGALQMSRDGGLSWAVRGAPIEDAIGLAASAAHSETVYLARQSGLFQSQDGGAQWRRIHPVQTVATMVHVSPDGTVYAYLHGVGLVRAPEATLRWDRLAAPFQDSVLLHLAVDPGNPRRLFAAKQNGMLIRSIDGGQTWIPLLNRRQ